jgi:hypothetical protein
MSLTVCPTAVVAAPVEVVWENLVHWERYAAWADVQVERLEPEGPITVGQTISKHIRRSSEVPSGESGYRGSRTKARNWKERDR